MELSNSLLPKIFAGKFSQDYQRRMSFQKVRLFDHAIQFDFPALLNVDLGVQLYRIKNGVITHYFVEDLVPLLEKKLFDFFKSPNSADKIKELIKYLETSLTKLDNFSISIPIYSNLSDVDLLKEYQNFCKIEREFSFMNQLLFLYVENALTKAIKSISSNEKLLEILSLQTEPIPLEVYYLDICEHLLSGLSKEELYQKYLHFGRVDVIDQKFSRKKLEHDIEDMKKKNPSLIKYQIQKKYYQNTIQVKKLFSIIPRGSHLYLLMEYFQFYSNKKEWKNFIREKSSYKLSLLLEEISDRKSISFEDLSYLREEEICDLVQGKISNVSEIKQRRKDSFYLIHKSQIEVIEEEIVLAQIDQHLSNKNKTIKGDVACKGKVQGKVCILLSNQDFHKFEDGAIIVAPTTRPDYVPLMAKSSAIVTNEGGILSHAAILSREFDKPCVIGTKIATTVLNDGDLVEVDAEEGVIRRLSD